LENGNVRRPKNWTHFSHRTS